MTRWQHLRRFVLEPAVKQINSNTTGAGFRVRMRPEKEGRAIKRVVFEVLKTKERQALDAELRDLEKQLDLFDVRLGAGICEKAREPRVDGYRESLIGPPSGAIKTAEPLQMKENEQFPLIRTYLVAGAKFEPENTRLMDKQRVKSVL